jgi:putative NADPH-quinone reductase
MKKKILVIDGHPNESSFCNALADAYVKGAKASDFDVQTLALRNLKFDMSLRDGYRIIQELEPDLVEAQNKIKWCEHLVVIYPIWWGTMPALLKGFLDRCWLPGFAFKYHANDPFWDRLLAGRSARMIVTSDAPTLYNLIINLNAPVRIMKKMVLEFCGFKPVKTTAIGSVKNLSEPKRSQIIEGISKLGSQGA